MPKGGCDFFSDSAKTVFAYYPISGKTVQGALESFKQSNAFFKIEDAWALLNLMLRSGISMENRLDSHPDYSLK
jgi:hypothetical protein